MVTLERMGEVAETGHIHPAYCCRVVQGLAHCGYPRHVPSVLSHASPLLIETHLTQKRDAGVVGLEVRLGLGIRIQARLLWFPTPQESQGWFCLFLVCVGCVWYVCSCARECMHTCMNLCVEARCL